MWSSVANLKESLSKIALDVHDDDDDEISIYSPPHDRFGGSNGVSGRRISRNFTRSDSPMHSPIVNGLDSPYNHEIDQYKADIKRLKESEAEIKALSVNYAALLKEKEDLISRLAEENGSLKQNLLKTNATLVASKTALKANGDLSPTRQNKAAIKIRGAGSAQINGIVPKQDGLRNETISANSKELTDALEEKNQSMSMMEATHEAQMKQMVSEIDKEREKFTSVQKRLQEEKKLNGSLQQELGSLKSQNDEISKQMHKTHDELNQKISEIGGLQRELQRSGREETDDSVEKLKTLISALKNENSNIKKEKDEFEAALKAINSSPVHQNIPNPSNNTSVTNEDSPCKEEPTQSLMKMEKELNEIHRERDKAVLELNRLKQHLLEKESEESDKMDEDSKVIVELQEINEYQRVQIVRLEKALKQAIGSREELKMSNNNDLKKSKEIMDELNGKLTSCMSTIDAKNVEILNLQTALGQYYAEIEAKERLGEELSVVKEESTRLLELLKEEHRQVETSKREKEEMSNKLSLAERMLDDRMNRVRKLEEDNDKLRRALEQSMARLNRMSVDSDFLVDRRIVIKLLVTYFQRNHSKEVLELMVRMLGFSDEDKKRIGVAQQGAGKGIVQGVLRFPGRLVGGILGGSSIEASISGADNQSFADLWVDFLLTETEQREKRELMDATNGSKQDHRKGGSNAGADLSAPDHGGGTTPTLNSNQNQMHSSIHENFWQRQNSNSEFSNVPLTSFEGNSSQYSTIPRRY